MPLAQRILSTTTLGLLLCTLAVFGSLPAQAGHSGGLHIDDASWDGATLTADGGADKPKRGGGPVEIFDADPARHSGWPICPTAVTGRLAAPPVLIAYMQHRI